MEKSYRQLPQWELRSQHSGEIAILKKLLGTKSGSKFIFLEFNDPTYRDKVITHIDVIAPGLATIHADKEKHPTYEDFEQDLFAAFEGHKGIHVLNMDSWFNAPGGISRIRGFNYHRENIAENCQGPLLMWLTRESIRKMALEAADFWSWRAAVLDFSIPRDPVHTPILERQIDDSDSDFSSRLKRIQEIDDYLRQNKNDLSENLLLNLVHEQGKHFTATGDYQKALNLLDKALSLAKKVNNKREMAFILRDIASIKHEQGLGKGSLEMRMKASRILKDLGDERTYAYTLLEIASDLLYLKQDDGALSQYEEAIKIFKDLGMESDVLHTLRQIIRIKNRQGLTLDTLALDFEALGITIKTSDPNHPEYATRLNNLALILHEQGKYDEAKKLLREVLEIDRKTVGPDHPEYAKHLNNLAQVLAAQGLLVEAEDRYREALEIDRKIFGPNHPEYAIHLNNLAQVLAAQGLLGEAEDICREALEIARKTIGPNRPGYAKYLNNLVRILAAKGLLGKVADISREALEIERKTVGPDHPEYARHLKKLAQVLAAQGQHDEAEELIREASQISQRLGIDDPD